MAMEAKDSEHPLEQALRLRCADTSRPKAASRPARSPISRRMGNVIIVRYADDLIIGFELDKDARRFQEAMCERLREFSLSLHPEKTRLIEFGRFAVERGQSRPNVA
jgi:hypothetical protein